MSYYGKRRYRSWRSRNWRGSAGPSKFSTLSRLFGGGVLEIRKAFLSLDEDARDELFSDYGEIYGNSAEKYARKTFPNWKSGSTALSGQTMERLVELVPPYLAAKQRFSILQSVLKHHKKSGTYRTVSINVENPGPGFAELQDVLSSMTHGDVLAHLPENVMKAASWLFDDDITAARAMLAEAERLENDLIRDKAKQEIELLRRTISSGQVSAASYTVEMPAGKLNVVAFTPSKCFVATVCFGQFAAETSTLREWRDRYLVERSWGRKFIVWYYNHGAEFAAMASCSPALKVLIKAFISILAKVIDFNLKRGVK